MDVTNDLAMRESEVGLFKTFLSASSNYLEFGCGDSTHLASRLVSGNIVSVDASLDWIGSVQRACSGEAVQPRLLHVDIGPTGDWGFPVDSSARDRWPDYYTKPWELPECYDTDMYLVGGRFRVACAMSILLHCRQDAVILVRGTTSRPDYHPIREVAREVSHAEDISAFVPAGASGRRIAEILDEHRFVFA